MMERGIGVAALGLAVVALMVSLSSRQQLNELSARVDSVADAEGEGAGEAPAEEFELADAMQALALRISNLWFVRQGSLPLFDYEVYEIEEIFAEIKSAKPVEAGRDVAEEIDLRLIQQLPPLRAALQGGDMEGYEEAYRALLSGCNDCHQATAHPFIRVGFPAAPQIGNRVFGD